MKSWKLATILLAVAAGAFLIVPAVANTPLYPHPPENPCQDSSASGTMEPLSIYASPTPQERFDAAELVVIGRVADASARCDGPQIMTYMQVEVEESLKNPQNIETLTAKTYGGTVGDYELRVADPRIFNKGDRVFLYLNKENASDDAYEIGRYSGALARNGSPDYSIDGREILETFRLQFITAENMSPIDIARGSGKEVTLSLKSFFGYDFPTNLTVSSFARYREQGVFSTENVTRLGDFGLSVEPADAVITPPANGTAEARFLVRASDEAVLGVYDIHVSSIDEDRYSNIAGGIGDNYIRVNVTDNSMIPTSAKLSQDEAIRIVENDFRSRQSEYDRITGIIVNNTSGYVKIEEFRERNLTLPLVYVDPNGSLIRITKGDHENMGGCNSGLRAYCGYLEPYNFDYEGRLVYGVEVLLWNMDNPPEAESGRGFPFLYIVDANTGEMVDSTFLRSEHKRAQENEG